MSRSVRVCAVLVAQLVVVGLMLGLAACGGEEEMPKKSSYTAVADPTLLDRIGEVDGVTAVDIDHLDTFETGNAYIGTISVAAGADARAALDHAIAILRQGAEGAAINVSAAQGAEGQGVTMTDLGLPAGTDKFLTKRYGPQPGDGQPPPSTPQTPR